MSGYDGMVIDCVAVGIEPCLVVGNDSSDRALLFGLRVLSP